MPFYRPNVPAANIMVEVRVAARTQNRSCSLLKVWIAVRLAKSLTRTVLSSPQDTINSCLGWNRALDTLLRCPLQELTSQAFVSLILHILIVRSSAAETINRRLGWKDAKLTPRSWPSKTYLTVENVSNVSKLLDPLAGVFLRKLDISQTRTVWSIDVDTMRPSFGWN